MSGENTSPAAGRQKDHTRQRIIEAARTLFGAEGFDRTTVRQIAEKVGLTDAALYHHFRSKREILNAIWELPVPGGVARFHPDHELTGARLDEIVDAMLDFTISNDNFLRLMAREILSGDETALALRQQSRSVARMTLYEHFITIFDAEEAESRADAVLAMLTGTSMKTQMSAGLNFAATVNEFEYRERTRRWARRLARLEETKAG